MLNRIKIILKVLGRKGMSGHFWVNENARQTPDTNRCALKNGKVVHYNFMSGKDRHAYDKYNRTLKYLGYGKVYSVKGTKQNPFR